MSYPPTPDPYSAPSQRRSMGRASQRSSQDSYRDSFEEASSHLDYADAVHGQAQHVSSADHYAAYGPTEGDLGQFARLHEESPGMSHDEGGHHQRLVGGESDPFLQASGSQMLHPLSPPPTFSSDRYSGSQQMPRSMSAISGADSYGRYSSANLSQAASMGDMSDDGDSQRVLHRPGGGGRRGSNLAYDSMYMEKNQRHGVLGDKSTRNPDLSQGTYWSRLSSRARKWYIAAGLVLVVVAAIIAGTTVSLARRAPSVNTSSISTSPSGLSLLPNVAATTSAAVVAPTLGVQTGTTSTKIDWRVAATGGDNSTVYTSDGSSFQYNNSFGGFWNAIPFNDSAQVALDVPPLNKPWDYNTNQIFGVNLGGWLIIEPFITPALFEPFSSGDGGLGTPTTVVDEWTLCIALGSSMASTIENHYATFITERDFAEIAGAGLNWVRIPVPFWIIETYPGEPFLAKVGWKYFLLALQWARKYGLRVNLDFHAAPGSQNGYNHSSKQGSINFMNGVMGVANAQRTLNYIRTLAEFISQDQYKNLVPMFSILNEPLAEAVGVDNLRKFYLEVYQVVRGITGVGAGNGPMIAFHDGFVPYATPMASGGWDGFLTGADRVALDSHPYLCFSAPNNDGLSYQAAKPCSTWANDFNITREQFGVFVGGEWSLAINDCGKWINNVGNGQRYNGTYVVPGGTTPQYAGIGSCQPWDEWENYSNATKAGFMLLAEGHMDAIRDWFFWTWKTGYSTTLNRIANPMWNYQLALAEGYMPMDPRRANGACAALVAANDVVMTINPAPTFSSWQTGGAGAGVIDASQLSQWGAWPPATIGTYGATLATAFLPTFTPTQAIITQPSGPSPTSFPSGYSRSVNIGSGWVQASDSQLMFTPIAGCTYPNAWSGLGAPVPTSVCKGAGKRRRDVSLATPTPAPMPTPTSV